MVITQDEYIRIMRRCMESRYRIWLQEHRGDVRAVLEAVHTAERGHISRLTLNTKGLCEYDRWMIYKALEEEGGYAVRVDRIPDRGYINLCKPVV